MAEDEESKDEESIYDEEGREDLVDDGEISSEEAGFMQGYEEAEESEEESEEEEKDKDEVE
jgi:hypothetical protein